MQELTKTELINVDGGGFASMVAGGLGFGLIGMIVSLPAAAITGDPGVIGKTTTLFGSIGVYVGAGCPLP